jgi:hypothetical protein
MYDFYFGSREEIARDEIKFLISIKRMMPRWVNSIPDSEFIALAKLLDEQGASSTPDKKLIAVETGAGASSLAFIFYAMKFNGLAMTWDLNGEKGSLIRTVSTETIGNYFRKHIDEHWKFVAFNTLSPYLGLPILNELADHIDLFFHDSEHVWNTVKGELEIIMPLLGDGAVVALDDANQDYLHTNIAYINTFRRKLDLPAIKGPEGNTSQPFYLGIERLLHDSWESVEYLPDLYKQKYLTDPYFAYFNSEFEIKAKLGTERTEKLDHRFDSWRVSKRRKMGDKA